MIFLCFWKVSYAKQGCIYLNKNTVKTNIVKYYFNVKSLFFFTIWIYRKMSFIPVMRSWIFSIITPVFSVTWSSEIILICWFAVQETFLIIILSRNNIYLNEIEYKYFVTL